MGAKAKAAVTLVVVIGVLGVGIAIASAGEPKKKKVIPPRPEVEPDLTETDNDVEVDIPTDDGKATVVVDSDDAEAELETYDGGAVTPKVTPTAVAPEGSLPAESVPAYVAPEVAIDREGSTVLPIDAKVQAEAAATGRTEEEVANDIVEEMTGGQQASPIAVAETSPALDPDGTVALARTLLARETLPSWKDDMQEDVKEWQKGVGIEDDGKFGLGSIGRMAEEVGILPLVRYWPKGTTSKKDAEQRYDSVIAKAIIAARADLPDSQAQIDGLTASMNREVAVSYGVSNPPPQDTREFAQDVNDAIAEAAELKGEQEIKA